MSLSGYPVPRVMSGSTDTHTSSLTSPTGHQPDFRLEDYLIPTQYRLQWPGLTEHLIRTPNQLI